MTTTPDISTLQVVDAQSLAPPVRHATILGIADALAQGAAFILENTHDPKPLHHQLDAIFPDQFSWTYLQSGPDAWRIEIRRVAAAA